MRYWWVNHKQTFRHEVGGGYQTRKPPINVKKVDLSQMVIGAAMEQSDLSRTSSLLNHR